jgi:outer membrane protein TolC
MGLWIVADVAVLHSYSPAGAGFMARMRFDVTDPYAVGGTLPDRRLASALTAASCLCGLLLNVGCATTDNGARTSAAAVDRATPTSTKKDSFISLVAHQQKVDKDDAHRSNSQIPERVKTSAVVNESAGAPESLSQLENLALARNPHLRRLSQEVAAARARSHYVDKLPDPTVAGSVFGHPIETAAGSQRASATVGQMIPWLKRLDAQSQQACFEALVLQKAFEVERLKTVGDLRERWFRLYVLRKQIETSRANQELLTSLIEVANARVATGQASQGDVLLGTLELSRLQEQILTFKQQVEANKAELNRLVGRDAASPIEIPGQLAASLPEWSHPMLRQLARERQPAIAAAQLRTQATRWGVEVARLKRRPDVSLSANWFAIDDNRPSPSIVDVGRDAWSLGAQVSVPLWRQKYDAIEQEARWKHFASHASAEDVEQRYDALLRDLWEQAKTADETSTLYQETILLQARQTLQADQQSYTNATVEFDRVVRDFRNVLTLELGYHRAVGQLRTALARIRQAVGTDLSSSEQMALPLPSPRDSTESGDQSP